ncbi:MAG: helix-turn-helix domain-containing protein, partial [Chloroflexota bacterium]|nr:helix-turn-helix domain-containing protein [Chloroflexota bacterium]
MRKLTALVPGYATVARASEILQLAPRSVRDLIYSGRLPSVRLARAHYIRAADVEAERRRRLGLPARAARP